MAKDLGVVQVNLKEFDKKLENHDWFYYFSDDRRVYKAGKAEAERIESIAQKSIEHYKLYTIWADYFNSKYESLHRDELRAAMGIL